MNDEKEENKERQEDGNVQEEIGDPAGEYKWVMEHDGQTKFDPFDLFTPAETDAVARAVEDIEFLKKQKEMNEED